MLQLRDPTKVSYGRLIELENNKEKYMVIESTKNFKLNIESDISLPKI